MNVKSDEEVALHNCDKEPVHIPGRIQSFGSLLAFELSSGEILHQSENLSQTWFGSDSVFLGNNFEEVISNRKIVHAIRGALGLPTIRHQRDRVGSFELGKGVADVAVYATGDVAVVEFEPGTPIESRTQTPVSIVRSMMSVINAESGMSSLLDSAVRTLRHVTGHDRVMAYRFFDNGDGEVCAEAKGPGIEPYLGLRYPAWDIPTQVRQIMLRAPFRIITDIRDKPAALISAADTGPLDLTLSHLRGVSPIYVEYLENMGVRATMNISIIVHGRLWGMFAFHHYRPRQLPADQRTICELFGQLASMLIQQAEERAKLAKRNQINHVISSVGSSTESEQELTGRLAPELLKVLNSDGVCVVGPEKTESNGDVPAERVIRELVRMADHDYLAIDSLSAVRDWNDQEALGKSAGVLMFRLPADQWLALFRNEVIHEIRWAGAKEKELTYGPNGPRLTPRESFAEYKESVSGRCHPWSPGDMEATNAVTLELWKNLQSSSTEHTKQLERQKQRQDLLIAELNHRVRNTLALVRSIARQTTTSSKSVEHYVSMLEQRISALSSAHELIGGSGLQWAHIQDLLRSELKPFEFEDDRVKIEGPPTAVRADIAPILALLFHEMTANSVKHGALSESGGQLRIRWQDKDDGVSLFWIEDLPAPIEEPKRRGFGLALIERVLPHECDGKSKVEFGKNQLRITFWLPAEKINRLAANEVSVPTIRGIEPAIDSLDLSGLNSVIVVEDNVVLAMELERMLTDLGVDTVDSLPNAERAITAVQNNNYDCGILDVNLGKDTSFQIAELLQGKGVPVILASGYDSKYQLPDTLFGIPRLTKPVGKADLVNAVKQAVIEQANKEGS